MFRKYGNRETREGGSEKRGGVAVIKSITGVVLIAVVIGFMVPARMPLLFDTTDEIGGIIDPAERG
jgi:hypothetical protein